ncbi:hypothetical protein vseg_006599 [Gypsophila vaccaria]
MDDDFMMKVYEVVTRADLFTYSETDENFTCELVRFIRSCYRFSVDVLRVICDYSLVFVVEVMRARARDEFVEGKKKLLLVPSVDMGTLDKSSDVKEESSRVDCVLDDELSDCSSVDNDDSSMDDDDYEDLNLDEYDFSTMDYEDCEEEEEEDDDFEARDEKERMNNILRVIREWQGIKDDVELILDEVKPAITYEMLEWRKIGHEYVIAPEEEKRGECGICLGSYTGNLRRSATFPWVQESNAAELARLNCGHAYHHRCIFKWLERNPTCPMCRAISYVTV